jgi:hypothetical protein
MNRKSYKMEATLAQDQINEMRKSINQVWMHACELDEKRVCKGMDPAVAFNQLKDWVEALKGSCGRY